MQAPPTLNNVQSQGLLQLATRPQNYESLSLTNSTEFGHHSISSSVEFGNQPNTVLSSHKNMPSGKPSVANPYISTGKENERKPEQKDWRLPFQQSNNTIIEDLKEEDISFAHS